MRIVDYCKECGSTQVEFRDMDFEHAWCPTCEKTVNVGERIVETPYERCRSRVYATGNKWAIENFNATHN